MPSCDCCWADASWRHWDGSIDINEAYYAAMKDHEARRCVCTQNNPEGEKARAGCFWDGKRDTRNKSITRSEDTHASK